MSSRAVSGELPAPPPPNGQKLLAGLLGVSGYWLARGVCAPKGMSRALLPVMGVRASRSEAMLPETGGMAEEARGRKKRHSPSEYAASCDSAKKESTAEVAA